MLNMKIFFLSCTIVCVVKAFHINGPQLRIERSVPQATFGTGNSQYCEFCENFSHYLQEAGPRTEEELELIMGAACSHFATSLSQQCHDFIENYGDYVIAIFAQENDPSAVCTMLNICPGDEILSDPTATVKDQRACLPCYLAVEAVVIKLGDDRTEEETTDAVYDVCNYLPNTIRAECDDIVMDYAQLLIALLNYLSDPKEVCTTINLC